MYLVFLKVNISWMLLKGNIINTSTILDNLKPKKENSFMLYLKTVDTQTIFYPPGLCIKDISVHFAPLSLAPPNHLLNQSSNNKKTSVVTQTFSMI